MTTSHHTSSPLAALAAQPDSTIGLAALALDSAADNNGWQQLLPAGHFSAVDGRPDDVPGGQWFIDADIANQLIAQAQAAQNDLVIDYEHQTLNAERNGQPAIAAGWFAGSDMEWRDGSGLWIKPQWTPRALDHIRNDEYRYLSAVFPYDKRTGTPLALHSAALVNRPGIDGMAAVEALRAANHAHSQTETETETPAMNELMKQLMAKLGIELADGVEPTDEQRTAALAALSALQSKASGTDALNTELAALKAKGTEVDLSKFVPAATYNALVVEVASLKAGSEQSVTDLLDDAHKQGQIIEAERTYLTDLASQQGVATLKTVLDARAPVADLASQQTKDKKPPDDSGLAVLSADEKKVCVMTGISEDDFLKTKKQLAGTQ